jgi:sec-independent protein translocase protein TatB
VRAAEVAHLAWRTDVFLDLSFGKILFLAVIAIVVFGPDQLPKMAQQAGRTLRELRRLADGATRDIREGLGPEFEEFDLRDLHPGNFVRNHLCVDDWDGRGAAAAAAAADPVEYAADRRATATIARDEQPAPFDTEAT